MNWIEIIGWTGAIAFMLSAAPQAHLSWKQGHSRGISEWLLTLWMVGEILSIIYVLGKHGLDMPLLSNYIVNIVFISIIIKYKIRER
jgi:uncharacterized protein with PQ loop repeat